MADDAWQPLVLGRFRSFYLSLADRSTKDWKRIDDQNRARCQARLRVMAEAEHLTENWLKKLAGFDWYEVRFPTKRAHRGMTKEEEIGVWVIYTIVEHPKKSYAPVVATAEGVRAQHLEKRGHAPS